MSAPARASPNAIAAPIPRLAPVTTALLPVRSPIFTCSLIVEVSHLTLNPVGHFGLLPITIFFTLPLMQVMALVFGLIIGAGFMGVGATLS
jgi:hypothetical protein